MLKHNLLFGSLASVGTYSWYSKNKALFTTKYPYTPSFIYVPTTHTVLVYYEPRQIKISS